MIRPVTAIEPPHPANEDGPRPRRLIAVPLETQDAREEIRVEDAPPPQTGRLDLFLRLARYRPRFSIFGAAELLLLAVLALQCARLFWSLAAPLGPVGDWTAPVPPPVAAAPRSASLAFDPFFRNRAAAGPVVVTSLDLTLHGVREDRATGQGSAIIGTSDGRQNSYEMGEEIMPGVALTGVQFDSVTISREGRTEQIFLASATSDAPATGAAPAPAAPPDTPR